MHGRQTEDVSSPLTIFHALGNAQRLAIVEFLIAKQEFNLGTELTCNVTEMFTHFAMSASHMAHQLRVLRLAGVVVVRKVGKERYYSVPYEVQEVVNAAYRV